MESLQDPFGVADDPGGAADRAFTLQEAFLPASKLNRTNHLRRTYFRDRRFTRLIGSVPATSELPPNFLGATSRRHFEMATTSLLALIAGPPARCDANRGLLQAQRDNVTTASYVFIAAPLARKVNDR